MAFTVKDVPVIVNVTMFAPKSRFTNDPLKSWGAPFRVICLFSPSNTKTSFAATDPVYVISSPVTVFVMSIAVILDAAEKIRMNTAGLLYVPEFTKLWLVGEVLKVSEVDS